ncbi:MAG: hypothetical protein KZQ76_11045 [Candidatus Thiodiazotropha sp. (ex Epidulcina cf. delphinae)]|nr:hypothetical protein [Candidatus Thiodiazotropha sp. (ex Epidulcina cf. delphinae)]
MQQTILQVGELTPATTRAGERYTSLAKRPPAARQRPATSDPHQLSSVTHVSGNECYPRQHKYDIKTLKIKRFTMIYISLICLSDNSEINRAIIIDCIPALYLLDRHRHKFDILYLFQAVIFISHTMK